MIAKRLEGVGEYYFSRKLREIDLLNKEGRDIINLGIGSPDMPPHPEVIAVLREESGKADGHAYQSYKGSPVLRHAFADWYLKWYGVALDAETEILPLIGSKEGIMHICMTYLEEGDIALVPDPGYPTYASAVKLAGAQPVYYPLKEENGWAPDFAQLEQSDLSAVKLMFVNYPHMPTGTPATEHIFHELVAFAQRNHILLVHDNPYSFILNDRPVSLFSVPGARSVALELNSLSKSHNMAGWRIGMLSGEKERINEVLRYKSNMDSGMFLPLQLAAATALGLGKDWYDGINEVYRSRRDKVYTLLDRLGCTYATDQVGMFVWAAIPEEYADGYVFSDEVLHRNHVFITPGGIFGSQGNRFIRVSLCSNGKQLDNAISRISVPALTEE
jgi:LL-diaminopimelate aminotransferase